MSEQFGCGQCKGLVKDACDTCVLAVMLFYIEVADSLFDDFLIKKGLE